MANNAEYNAFRRGIMSLVLLSLLHEEDIYGYNKDAVKSTDKDAIERIIEDIDALLETENLTDAEEKAFKDAKTKAEGLLDTIEETAEDQYREHRKGQGCYRRERNARR